MYLRKMLFLSNGKVFNHYFLISHLKVRKIVKYSPDFQLLSFSVHDITILINKDNHSHLKGEGKMQIGEKIKIKSLSQVNSLVKRRLLDFGITEGTIVSIQNIMPFSGPYILEYEGSKVGIRRKEVQNIEVEII
ncbi:FeoA family protein [Niallia sp. 01092]|uniref:FeoA family protein n=1 Tax=unclassified Niallia TaxID=2837522 RepID=UPI003FD1B4FB